MKTSVVAAALAALTCVSAAAHADPKTLESSPVVGLNLGELPWQGSFKPGVSAGYHFNRFIYAGALYQISDSIQRDKTSFNAKGIGVPGLQTSREDVGQRFLLHTRLRPHRLSPFLSVGLVFNDQDREVSRYAGDITVVQTRQRALRPAIGVGYAYTFDFGLQLSTEWAGWVFEKPTPDVKVSGGNLSAAEQAAIERRAVNNFKGSITNAYHVFSIGVGYTF